MQNYPKDQLGHGAEPRDFGAPLEESIWGYQ